MGSLVASIFACPRTWSMSLSAFRAARAHPPRQSGIFATNGKATCTDGINPIEPLAGSVHMTRDKPPQRPVRRDADAPRRRHYSVGGQVFEAPALAGGLYLVATPIGNLRDVTLRALEVFAAADLIACEDTRVTRKLLDHYGIATPMTPYHDHNATAARPRLLARLAAGSAIALVSDAGTPLISDPGFKLVRETASAGHAVTALPGA